MSEEYIRLIKIYNSREKWAYRSGESRMGIQKQTWRIKISQMS